MGGKKTKDATQSNAVPSPGAVPVTDLHLEHPRIRAKDWCAPLIHRLLKLKSYRDGSATMSVSFRNVKESTEGTIDLAWKGCKEDVTQCVNTYQEPVLTELATLGLSCVLLTRHTGLRISEVTRRGERVDYWIGDAGNRKRFVLEVGGEQRGSIDALSQEKTQQLSENPWSRSGYICVAVYDDVAARLWFCEAEAT